MSNAEFPTKVLDELRIEIFQFEIYDGANDQVIRSKRWGTRAGIESIRGTILPATKRVVDASAVNSDVTGLTAIGYTPD